MLIVWLKILSLMGLCTVTYLVIAKDLDVVIRDPTAPYMVTEDKNNPNANGEMLFPQEFIVTAIFMHDKQRVAIVNNKVVHEGDEVRGKVIKHIDSSAVVLADTQGEQEIKIKLLNKSVHDKEYNSE